MYTLNCKNSHRYCADCIYTHTKMKIEDGSNIQCPECDHILSSDEIKQIGNLKGDSKLIQKFNEKSFISAVNQMKDAVQCPVPDCKGIAIRSDMDDREEVICANCNFCYCSLCRKMYHYRTTCEEATSWGTEQTTRRKGHSTMKRLKEEEQDSINAVKSISTPCPKCLAPVQKTEGCDHMTCSICKVEFCWKCLSLFLRTPKRGLTHTGPCDPSQRHSRSNSFHTQRFEKRIKENESYFDGLNCDQCKKVIKANFFECIHCKNFVICLTCEATKGTHNDKHIFKFIKIEL